MRRGEENVLRVTRGGTPSAHVAVMPICATVYKTWR